MKIKLAQIVLAAVLDSVIVAALSLAITFLFPKRSPWWQMTKLSRNFRCLYTSVDH